MPIWSFFFFILWPPLAKILGPSLPQIAVNKLDNQIISSKQKPPNELNKTQNPQCFISHQILEELTIIIKK